VPPEPSIEPLPLSENGSEVGPERTSAGSLGAQLVAHESAREAKSAEIGEVVELAPSLRFNGKPVPPSLAADALAALAYYNEQAGQTLKPTTASGKPTEGLSRILGAMTEHPEVRIVYRRMIDHTLASRWWGDDEPHPGVIFGKRVAEQSIQRAHGPRPGPSLRGLTPSGRAIAKLLAADAG
jgi:hypothetical protein